MLNRVVFYEFQDPGVSNVTVRGNVRIFFLTYGERWKGF